MSIKWKGKLNSDALEKINVTSYKKLNPQSIDYILVIIILSFPVYCSLNLLMCPYQGSFQNLIIGDVIGFIVLMPILLFHEYLHAITFSNSEDVTIWYRGFTFITYCTEERTPTKMIYTLLLPNLVITLPFMLISIYLYFFISPSLILKICGVVNTIIILGSISDLLRTIYIFRNKNEIHMIRVNDENLYYI